MQSSNYTQISRYRLLMYVIRSQNYFTQLFNLIPKSYEIVFETILFENKKLTIFYRNLARNTFQNKCFGEFVIPNALMK